MLNFLTLDKNKVTEWILITISPKNIKHFDPNLAPIMYNLAKGRVSVKFNKAVLVQKSFLHGIANPFLIYTWFMN